jgi:hypothetical protein
MYVLKKKLGKIHLKSFADKNENFKMRNRYRCTALIIET